MFCNNLLYFSNNFINQVIQINFEKYDDFMSYYVNLYKSLSPKSNKITFLIFLL